MKNILDAVQCTCLYFNKLWDRIGSWISIFDQVIPNNRIDNTMTDLKNQRQSALEIKHEANVPQKIQIDNEFPVDTKLIIETEIEKNVSISIFFKISIKYIN